MLLGLVVAATVLLGLELLLSATRGIWDPPAPNFRILRNRSDPEAVAIDLGAHATVLGETMLFHIVSNELTRPDPELLFRVRPNPSGDAVYGYTGINAQGFRGRTIDVAESLKHKSVVILGDSCGFGWGIRKFERTWAATLEQKLMESDPDFRIYNLSQPGYSTAQARALYETWAQRLEPDVLILYLGWNDLWPTGRWDDTEAMERVRWMNRGLVPLLQKSQLYQFLAIQIGPTRLDVPRDESDLPYRPRVSLADSEANLRSIIEDAHDRNTRVLIIPPPALAESIDVSRIERIGEFNQMIHENFAADVESLALPALRDRSSDPGRLFRKDGYHPNRHGAAYIADELLRQILEPK